MDGLAVPGKLKLKKGGVSKKKKKSSSSVNSAEKEKNPEPIASAALDSIQGAQSEEAAAETYKAIAPRKTKAELAFEKRQAELRAERVLKKAQISHREKVEKFNEKMESLTEFNDIPKVSWTK